MIAQVGKAIVGGLQSSPALLLIVVLNVAAIGGAVYYLIHLDATRERTVAEMMALLRTCIEKGP